MLFAPRILSPLHLFCIPPSIFFSHPPHPHSLLYPSPANPPQIRSRPPPSILSSLTLSGILPASIFFAPPRILSSLPLSGIPPLKLFSQHPPHILFSLPLSGIPPPPQFFFAPPNFVFFTPLRHTPPPRILSSLPLFDIPCHPSPFKFFYWLT